MAGSRESRDGASPLDVAVESVLFRVFFSCLFASVLIAKPNMLIVGVPGGWARRDWECMPVYAMRRW